MTTANPSSFFARSLLVLLLAAVAGCATVVNPVSGEAERTVMDERSELEAGRQAHQQVLREYGVYANPALQAYVNGIGQKLAQQSHRAELKWTFTLLDSPEINAFALPGGYVYMTRGLMAYLDSEAELAGVLGHEIGHVTARHASQRATREQQAGLGVAAVSILGAVLGERYGLGNLGDIAGQGAQIAALRATRPYDQRQELQADQLGAEYLQRVNFDPDVMVKVIGVLKAQEVFANDDARSQGRNTDSTPNWLRTHPSNDQRLSEIKRIADQYTGKYQDAGRTRYLQAISGMTFGDSRVHGVTRGQQFYHEPLGFTLRAPAKWSIQNEATEIGIVADNMQAAVAMKLSPNSRGDHAAAIRALLQPDQGRTDNTTINGLRATNFIGAKQGRAIDATVITLGSNDYVFQKMQKAEARGAYDRELREVVASFRALTPADAANAKPYTLRTLPLPRSGAPFAELGRDVNRIAPQLRNPEGQVRLLNQVYPQGNIAAGQLVKTIQ
jgi:predicted Zn-dependent protease